MLRPTLYRSFARPVTRVNQTRPAQLRRQYATEPPQPSGGGSSTTLWVVSGLIVAGIAYYFLKPEQAKAQLHKIESEADHLKAKGEKVLGDAKSQAKEALGASENKAKSAQSEGKSILKDVESKAESLTSDAKAKGSSWWNSAKGEAKDVKDDVKSRTK